MISLIISESALELVPFELEDHPSVVSHARKLGKYPSEILLDNSCIVIGGFQKGHFSDSVQNKITDLYSVGNDSFEGHIVTSRILYENEKTIFM